MKYFFSALLIALTSTVCTAQIQQFAFAVSTNFSYSKDNAETFDGITNYDITLKSINLQPKIGFFALKRFCLGVYVPYTWDKRTSDGSVGYDGIGRSIGIGPFVRYYQPLGKNFYGILGLGYSWHEQSSEIDILDSSGAWIQYEEERKTMQFQKSLGLAYFINRNIALEMMLDHFKQNNDSNAIFFNDLQEGIKISLGLQIYLFTAADK